MAKTKVAPKVAGDYMLLPLKDVYFPGEDRLRQEHGDLAGMGNRMIDLGLGQQVPILVRPPREDEAEAARGRSWVVEDGGRRYVVITALNKRGLDIPGLPKGHIKAVTIEHTPSELESLLIEFYTNEDRKEFTWKEKGEFIRRTHHLKSKEDPEWTVDHTAALLDYPVGTVYKYLQIVKNEDVYLDPRVQAADSFTTAYKQAGIITDQKRRKIEAEHSQKRVEKKQQEAVEQGLEAQDDNLRRDIAAHTMLKKGDVRDWIRTFPDAIFDWFHWDPPYGGDQEGGAFTSHERIDDKKASAFDLMADVIPQIHRTLKDGRWLAIWCHPAFTDEVRRLLQGHVLSAKIVDKKQIVPICEVCGHDWFDLDTMARCPKAPAGFWVNHYPLIWHKQQVGSTGHDIKRFGFHHYETCLLAAKWEAQEPILSLNNRSDILSYPVVGKLERRHVMHKPKSMLRDVIERISIPGELGGDGGAGSVSIIEGAVEARRRIVAVELSDAYWADGINTIKVLLEREGITSLKTLKEASNGVAKPDAAPTSEAGGVPAGDEPA